MIFAVRLKETGELVSKIHASDESLLTLNHNPDTEYVEPYFSEITIGSIADIEAAMAQRG